MVGGAGSSGGPRVGDVELGATAAAAAAAAAQDGSARPAAGQPCQQQRSQPGQVVPDQVTVMAHQLMVGGPIAVSQQARLGVHTSHSSCSHGAARHVDPSLWWIIHHVCTQEQQTIGQVAMGFTMHRRVAGSA